MHDLHHSLLDDLPASSLQERFFAALCKPMALQTAILQDLLHDAADTEIGRQYEFSSLHRYEDYARRVPLCSWADYAPAARRLEEGAQGILFPGGAVQFLQTSGSSGQNKLVPQSAAGMAVARAITRLRSHLRQAAISAVPGQASTTSLPAGKVLLLSGQSQLPATLGGIPVGYASGVTGRGAPGRLKEMHVCPAWVRELPDPAHRDFMLLRYALAQPNLVAAMGNNPRRFTALLEKAPLLAPALLRCIRGGNFGNLPGLPDTAPPPPDPSRAEELDTLLQQGQFLPKHYWPQFNMACFWLGGPMAPAVRQLRGLLPEHTLYFDAGYGASELKLNVPLGPGSPYAPPALFAGFFEFLPTHGGPALLCHQLDEGGVYELVLSSFSGLYRYRPGDLIRVEGFSQSTPNIAFYARVDETANLAGEKTAAPLLLAAAQAASVALQAPLHSFALWPDPEDGCYRCFYDATADPGTWARAFDEALQTLAAGYARRRRDGSLRPPTATRLPSGWAAESAALAAGGQGKTPLLLRQPPVLP